MNSFRYASARSRPIQWSYHPCDNVRVIWIREKLVQFGRKVIARLFALDHCSTLLDVAREISVRMVDILPSHIVFFLIDPFLSMSSLSPLAPKTRVRDACVWCLWCWPSTGEDIMWLVEAKKGLVQKPDCWSRLSTQYNTSYSAYCTTWCCMPYCRRL